MTLMNVTGSIKGGLQQVRPVSKWTGLWVVMLEKQDEEMMVRPGGQISLFVAQRKTGGSFVAFRRL